MRILGLLLGLALLALPLPAAAQLVGQSGQGQIKPAPGTTGSVSAVGAENQAAVATIAVSGSLSAAIDLGTARLTRIAMPATWTAANITFQTSFDCVTYSDLYDSLGTEYTVVASASREIIVSYPDFVSVRCLKVRSGTTGTPVVQTGARTINLVLVP